MYDLVIKSGRIIDPAQDIDDKLDIGINGDKIATVAADIPTSESRRVIDAKGKIVTPGLIDMHCHVYAGIHKESIEPDSAGVRQGVTTVVDAGSSGQAVFAGFPKYVIPSARTNIFCFLSLASQGQTVMPELRDWAEVDVDTTVATIESNRGIIKGVKLRLVGNLVASSGIKVWETARKIARSVGLPLMIHPGDADKKVPAALTREILSLMEPGDILCHVFTPKYGGYLRADGTLYPELGDAMKRGVILDTSQGRGNFSFNIARKAIAQGIVPTTITTDLTRATLDRVTYGLTVVMSKFLALGLDLKSVIKMTTSNPARVLGVEKRIGSLKPGMDADVSVLEMRTGIWELEDSEQQLVKTTKLLAPCYAVKSGQVIKADPVAQPKPLS